MKALWEVITLMKYATDEDDGRIPPGGWIGALFAALVVWAAWTVAVWIVQN